MIHYGIPVFASSCLGVLLAGVLSASARGDRAEKAYWRHVARVYDDPETAPGLPGITDEGHLPEAPV